MTAPLDKAAILALADRVERASADQQTMLLEKAFWLIKPNYADDRVFRAILDAAAYESAAILLVPEGETTWGIASFQDGIKAWVGISVGKAATPALALTAASLRALASERNG